MSQSTPPKPPAVPKPRAKVAADAPATAAAAAQPPPPAKATQTESNGAQVWSAPDGASRDQLGKCLQGQWRGRVDGKLVVVKNACPLLGLPSEVKKGLALSKMAVLDWTPAPPPETVVVDEDTEE